MKSASSISLTRRSLLTGAAGAALLPIIGMPKASFAQENVVKIGFLAPLTGPVAAWGKPGLDGCKIWADWMNDAGGIEIGGKPYKVELASYDDEDDAGKARTGATQLIRENDVKFIMMLGILLRTIDSFKTLDLIIPMTKGGPGQNTRLVALELNKQSFESFNMGWSSAYAVLLLLISIAMTSVFIFVLNLRRRKEAAE